jgi:hypothetical protein
MKKILVLLAAALLATGALSTNAQGRRQAAVAQNNSALQQPLDMALAGVAGEYHARALYKAILARFPGTLPYANILRAEENHIAALVRQYQRNGLQIPADPYAAGLTPPETLAQAAENAIKAEEDNALMYAVLLTQVKDPTLLQVFTRLQGASADGHLAALKRAAANNGAIDPATCLQNGQQRQFRGGGAGRGPNCGLCPNQGENCPAAGSDAAPRQQRGPGAGRGPSSGVCPNPGENCPAGVTDAPRQQRFRGGR